MTSQKTSVRCLAKGPSTVKRLCLGCFRLHRPGDIARTLPGYLCMCEGCEDSDSDTHVNDGVGTDSQLRFSL